MRITFKVPCGLTPALTADLAIAAEFSHVRLVDTQRHPSDLALDLLSVVVPTNDLDTALMILGDLMGITEPWMPTAEDIVS